jgi:hypothetical protein
MQAALASRHADAADARATPTWQAQLRSCSLTPWPRGASALCSIGRTVVDSASDAARCNSMAAQPLKSQSRVGRFLSRQGGALACMQCRTTAQAPHGDLRLQPLMIASNCCAHARSEPDQGAERERASVLTEPAQNTSSAAQDVPTAICCTNKFGISRLARRRASETIPMRCFSHVPHTDVGCASAYTGFAAAATSAGATVMAHLRLQEAVSTLQLTHAGA